MKAPVNRLFVYAVVSAVFAVTAIAQEKLPDSDPQLIGFVTYKMPESAIDAEIDGKVIMAIRVDKTGKPTKASVAAGVMWPCSTLPINELNGLYLDLSKAMLKLQFSPAIKDGKPVEKDIGLAFFLKNPKLETPPDIDPVTGKPRPGTIFGGNLNGKAKHLPTPPYPAEAKINRDTRSVTIEVLVDEQGKVVRAGVGNGPPILRSGSRESACGAKFTPTTLEGRPVKVLGDLTYNFRMQ